MIKLEGQDQQQSDDDLQSPSYNLTGQQTKVLDFRNKQIDESGDIIEDSNIVQQQEPQDDVELAKSTTIDDKQQENKDESKDILQN